MYQLTRKQAAILRDARRVATKAGELLSGLSEIFALACRHDPPDSECPVCTLFSLASTSEEVCGQLERDLDAALERGPDPNSTT